MRVIVTGGGAVGRHLAQDLTLPVGQRPELPAGTR